MLKLSFLFVDLPCVCWLFCVGSLSYVFCVCLPFLMVWFVLFSCGWLVMGFGGLVGDGWLKVAV